MKRHWDYSDHSRECTHCGEMLLWNGDAGRFLCPNTDDELLEQEFASRRLDEAIATGNCVPEEGYHRYSSHECPQCGQEYCWECSTDSQHAGPGHPRDLLSWTTCPKCGYVDEWWADLTEEEE